MPKSILEIEVNDEAFKQYLETFNRYQEQIKTMPGPWRETGEEATAVAATIAGMTIALDLHYDKVRKLAELEKEEAEARKKADEEHKRRLEEEDDIEKNNEARRRKAIEQTKEIAKNVADTAISLGKWALLGEGAALIGGALGLWGLDKFVEGIGRERRMAQGLGVTTGERQALSIQMQRYFDVNSNLENIAEAQADPSKRWAFSAMGVNPTGKDPAQLALEMATRAREIFIQGRGNEQYAQARGLLNFYSMDELRRLAATRPEDLARSVAATRKDIGLGISDKDSQVWQDFVIKVQEAGRTVENAFIKKLSELEKNHVLDRIVDAFTRLATSAIDKIDFDRVEKGLQAFAEFIGSEKFQQDFKTVIDDIGILAKKMVDALVWLHLIPDPNMPTPGGGAPGTAGGVPALPGGQVPGTAAADAKINSPLNPFNWVGRMNETPAYGGKGPGHLSKWAAESELFAANAFQKWGWSKEQTAGILANINAESAYNPFALGDQGHAYGIGQWHLDRQIEYAKQFGHSMQSVKDPRQALTEQLQFMQYEMTKGKFQKAGRDLKAAKSAYEAGYTVTTEYELPKNKEAVGMVRGAAAMIVVTVLNQTGHSVAATANAASR